MILIIDTTEDKSQIFLFKNSKKYKHHIFQAHFQHSENLLKEINNILIGEKTLVKDVKKIVVVNGPGSFTGCRVGVATANALAFSLNLPLVSINKEEIKMNNFLSAEAMLEILKKTENKSSNLNNIAQPFYKYEPHITKSKNI